MKKFGEVLDDLAVIFVDRPKNEDGTPYDGPPLPVEQRNDHYCPFDAERLMNPVGPAGILNGAKVLVKKGEVRPLIDAVNKYKAFDVLYEAHIEAGRVNDCKKYGLDKEPPRGHKLIYDINRDGPFDEWLARKELEDAKKDFNPGMQPQLRQQAKPEPSPILNMGQYEYLPNGLVFKPKAPKKSKYAREPFVPQDETQRKRQEKLTRMGY